MSLAVQGAQTRRMPIVNLCLIAVNLIVFMFQLSLGSGAADFIDRFGLVPSQVGAWLTGSGAAGSLLTLLTATFLHANWLQLVGNLVFLWIFGVHVEDRLGSEWYLGFYLLCGTLANFAQVFIDPSRTSPLIGASGAVAGVLAAYVLAYRGPRVSVAVPIICVFTTVDIPSLLMIAGWSVVQLLIGASALHAFSTNIGGVAWWAQVAGFACGLLLVTVLPKQVELSQPDWSASIVQRAQDDTGFVGFMISAISLISQVIQLAIGARVVALFFAFSSSTSATPYIDDLRRFTDPLVTPFDFLVPTTTVLGRLVDLPAVTAIFFGVVATAGVIWLIATLLYEPDLPAVSEVTRRSYV